MSHGQVTEHVSNHVTEHVTEHVTDHVTSQQLNCLTREQEHIIIFESQGFKPNWDNMYHQKDGDIWKLQKVEEDLQHPQNTWWDTTLRFHCDCFEKNPLGTLWSHFRILSERSLNEWLRPMVDTLQTKLWKNPGFSFNMSPVATLGGTLQKQLVCDHCVRATPP